ncbi:PREDICTED: very-long-chain (3R)-3-hydroxyacyl-CoA dehydratase 2 [Dufourea novaeangliae]|uniref:Very-long-chain (3R)-3-hydroxyacyl-CoA dehydratase n=1 Tax=Dufourea novaeangliae TaxID=178035 RepID=A0A154P6G0_DUFNO|nr:PREDICTED: very-long-chain (3R)-3-hydroxyacyl-CoA dehydratase 2 [Dufourea novaeangliae]XP_015428935.1 PREDICTED: very-long-chain (3R)-3-hydroxyacyl-CoA dehydratase 2 [Dufourea novaeangliae]KZC07431.1 3-hydroxyacyl-CoA dehydratase 2 [Dufourea novaeangliae]
MKSKKSGSVGVLYLKTYNLTLVFGWAYILLKYLQSDFTSTVDSNLWHNVKWPVIIFQHAALLEIIHAIVGLVKSNPVLTIFQVFSRIIIVDGVLLATPESYAASSIGLPLALLAWSITEIIRYLYYFMNLNECTPYVLTWLRYTLFLVLYPTGVTGELLCAYAATQYAKSHPEAWSYTLPNSWNFTFSYYCILVTIMLSYIPLFPQLFFHMVAQRHKILGKDSLKKAQ